MTNVSNSGDVTNNGTATTSFGDIMSGASATQTLRYNIGTSVMNIGWWHTANTGTAFDDCGTGYTYPTSNTNGSAVAIAMQYLGVPYVWGGVSPSGFDASGLVMYVYAQLGVTLTHSAADQFYSGIPISFSELQPGDLVFFGHPISHVGIYIGGGSMIHAPFEGSVVQISPVSSGGAYMGACRI